MSKVLEVLVTAVVLAMVCTAMIVHAAWSFAKSEGSGASVRALSDNSAHGDQQPPVEDGKEGT